MPTAPTQAVTPVPSVQPGFTQTPVAPPKQKPTIPRGPKLNWKKLAKISGIILLILAVIAGITLVAINLLVKKNDPQVLNASKFNTIQIPLDELADQDGVAQLGTRSLVINGPLRANDAFIISPSGQPSNANRGQIYYDQNSNQLAYFNGTRFVPVTDETTATVQSLGGLTGQLTLGQGLSGANGQISNSGVLSVQGQTGNITFTAGPGIVVDGTTITNAGVTSFGGRVGDITVGAGLNLTGGGELQNSGVVSATGGAGISVTNDGNGNITISNTGAGTGTVQSPGGTAGRIAKFTGVQTIEDSLLSELGTVVTVNGDLSVGGTLTLSTALPVGSGGTGTTSLANNGVVIGQGSGALTAVTAGGAGLCLISTAGAPSFQACPGGASVLSVNGLTGALTVANATGSGTTITINDASTSQKGIAQFNGTNFTATSGVINTAQDIHVAAAPTFGRLTLSSSQATSPMLFVNNTNASGTGNLIDLQLNGANRMSVSSAGNMTLAGTLNGQTISASASFTGSLAVTGVANLNGGATVAGTLNANTITPTGAMTVGATNQTLTLQGNGSTTLSATNAGSTSTLSFQTPTANVNYRLLTAAAGTYDICTTAGNCVGQGGGVTTTGGTANQLAKFDSASTITNSIISDDGSTVSIAGALAVNTITPTGALTIGAIAQNLTLQGASTSLSSTSGATTNTLTFATPSGGNKSIIVPNASGTVVVSASGPLAIDANGNITCPTCATGSSVTSLNGLSGALSIANASGSGSTITIQDASTTQKGIAQFNSTNFSASGGVINTIQNIAVTATPTFGALTLTSSQATSPMLLVNNTNLSGTGNLIDLQLNSVSRLAVTPAGNMTLTGTINGQTISSAANLTGTLAVAGAASLNGGASVTGTLTANTITPTGAMTVGAANQSLSLQGNASSTFSATSGANSTTLAFQTPTANVTYRLLTAAAGTYDICTTVGNCSGIGGGVTTSGGTTNTIPKFTGSQTIGDSIITDNGTTVTIGGTLAVNTITPTGAMTIGATGQNMLLQGASTSITSTNGGVTNSLVFATPSGGNKTITIPNATGTVAVSASGPIVLDANGNISCPTCAASGSGVTSLNGLTGALTIANASGVGSTITIQDASTSQKGIAQFNSTNFSASGGTVNTIQNINVAATPTFGALTLTSSQATSPMLLVNNTNGSGTGNLIDLQLNGTSRMAVSPAGNMTLTGTINGQTISSAASFTGTLAVTGATTLSNTLTVGGAANLNGGATVTGTLNVNTITPSGAMTIGATNQSLTLQGNASSTFTATSGANTTTLAFQTPTANVTYRLLTTAAGTYDICTTAGNCAGVGGGVTTSGGTTNTIPKFTGAQTIGDSIITDNGTTVSIGGVLAVNTITPTGALTIGATSQNLSLQGASTSLSSTSGGITNTFTFATPSGSNKTITVPNASGTVAVSASGPITLDSAGNIACPTCALAGSGVTSLNGLTGALSIANASGSGATITIQDASTAQKGIAQFNSTNFSASSGVINTIQDIAVSSAPTFGRLTVTSSQATNGMLLVNNTNTGATGNLLDLQLNGSSRLAVTPAGNMTLVGTLNGQTISSTANLTGTLAVAGAASLNGGATVTGTLTANTITPTGALTVGATTQSFLMQGNASSTITATNGANTTTLAFQNPTASVTYRLLTAAAGTYDICTTAGNCTGVGGGVTTPGGTAGTIAKFSASGTIVDSIITESGSTITIGGTLAVNTITPGAAMTIGATSQDLTLQGADTTISATDAGITNTLTFATPSGSNKTITIPNASGTVAVSASGPLAIDANGNITCATCATSGGGGGVTVVDSLNGLTGALTLANASGSGNTVTINDASTSQKGIAQFNSTNFSASAGVINTIQNINTTAAPTFGQLTLTSSQASAAMLTVNNTNVSASGNLIDLQLNGSSRMAVTPAGAMTLTGTLNGQTISSTASFTGTLAVAGAANLNGGATVTGTLTANTITPTGALTVGATNQSFTLQGNASSTITATSGASTTSLAFQTPTASVTYRLLTAAAGTYDICTTVGNCAGVGGGVTTPGGTAGTIAKFTASGTIADSIITESGTTITVGGTLAATTAVQAPLIDTASAGTLALGTTNATAINLNQNTVVAAGKSLTITGGNTASRPASPTEGMVYYDTTTKALLVYANGKWQADRSTATKIVAMGSTTGCSGSSPVASQNPDSADYVVTSCTSAQTTINTAIAALPSGGGTIYLLEGTYIIDGSINLPSNIKFTGSGVTTVIKLKDSINATVNAITNSGASNNNITVDNIKLDGNKANNTAGTQTGINFNAVSSSRITSIYADNFRTNGVLWASGSNPDNLISNSSFTSNTTSAVEATLTDSSITGNVFDSSSYGLRTNTGGNTSRYVTVSGNTFQNTSTFGVYLGTTNTNNYNVTGNVFNMTAGSAIRIEWTTGHTISSNIINGGSTGIHMDCAGSSTVCTNIISNNNITNVTSGGISATSSSLGSVAGTNITGNTVYNAGGSGSSNAINISGSGTNYNNSITGNTIIDTAGTGSAISIGANTINTYVSGNNFSGTGATSISDSGVSTIYGSQMTDSGSLVVRGTGGVGIGATTATSSLTVQGAYVSQQLTAPAAPTVVTQGTAGSTTYTYAIVANDGLGDTVASTGTSITTGNATLNGSNFNRITWNRVGGAISYKVYRTSSGGTPSSTGLIGTVAASTATMQLDDTGLAASGSAAVTNSTGGMSLAGSLQGTTATFGSASALTLGTSNSATGSIILRGASGTGTITLIGQANPTGNRTITFSDETGTVCLQNSTSCGFALTSGSGNYIQNQNSTDQTADFRISGTGRANTSILTPLLDTPTATALNIGTTNATAINLNQNTNVVGNLDVSGTLTAGSGNAFQVDASGNVTTAGTGTFQGASLTVGTASQTGSVVIYDGSSNTATLQLANLSVNRAISFGDEAGTVCLQNSTNCGFAPSSGSANYIQNQNSGDQTANFRITGTGRANTSITTPLLDSISGALAIGTTNATAINLNKSTTITGNLNQSTGTISLASNGNGSLTATGLLTLTAGAASVWSTSAGNLTIQAGTTSTLALQTGGAGTVSLGDINSTTINIGRGSDIARTITIGDTSGGTNAQAISIGNSGASSTTAIKGGGGITINASSGAWSLQGASSSTLAGTNGSFTTTFGFTTPTANTTINLPALTAGTYTVCTSSGNCAGAGTTLQSAYNNSSNPEITLDATRGALTVRDNSSAIGANLLEVQNNAGSTTYFAVSATGTTINGAFTATGLQPASSTGNNTDGSAHVIAGGIGGNTTGTTGQTAGNGGNIFIDGGAGGTAPSGSSNGWGGGVFISGGSPGAGAGVAGLRGNVILQANGGVVGIGTISPNINYALDAVNDINTAFNIRTGAVARIDNAGNLVNIGNITGTGAVTIASTGAGNDIIVNGADAFIVQDASQFTGTLQVDGVATFNSDVTLALAGTENLEVTSTVSGTTAINLSYIGLVNNTTSGTQTLQLIQNMGGSGVTDTLLTLDNADTDTVVTTGLSITSAAGNMTNAIDASDAEIVNALLFGSNDLLGTNLNISGSTGNLTTSGDVAVNGGDISSTAATLNITSGNYINFDNAIGYIFKNGGNNRAYINGQNGRLEVYAANSFGGMTIQGSGGNEVFVVQGDSSAVAIGYSDTIGTLLTLDTKTNAGDPTGVNGGMYYNSNAGKFRCYEGGSWKDCITASGVGTTLQAAYNSSTNPEITLDATRGALTVRDASTPLGANLLEIQNNGGSTTYLSVAAAGTTVGNPLTVQPTSTDGVALYVKTTLGNNVLTVDTANGRVGIGMGGGALPVLSNGGLEVNGALRLSGSGTSFTDTYNTPAGSSVNSKIVIPNQDPGAFGQLLALGLPSSSQLTSRAISLFDARTSAHQPTIGVFSPDESNLVGFSWEGSNSNSYVKTTGGNLILRSNATDIMTLLSGGNVGIGTTPSYKLDVAGSVNVSTGNTYKINGTDICSSSGCTAASGSANYIQNGTSVQTANMAIQSAADGSRSLVIRARASQTAETLRVESNGGTSQFAISAAGAVSIANSLSVGSLTGAGLTDCDASNAKLLWDSTTSQFSCGTDRASVTIRKSADETVTSNITVQNDDHFSFSVGANETWAFQMYFEVNGSATADFRTRFDTPAGATCRFVYNNIFNVTNTYTSTCGSGGEVINDQGDTFDNSYMVYGTVVTGGTAGTVQFRWAQGTSSGSTIVRGGGQLIAYKISGADLAEAYYTNDQSVMPGDVVQIDGSLRAGVQKSQGAYSQSSLGVVSTEPGFVLGEPKDAVATKGKPVLLALNGRVPVKVSMENGPIKAGDYLTASSKPGVAMKATHAGQMIGVALEDYKNEAPGGNGTTMVFVNPGWAAPQSSDTNLQGQNVSSFDGIDVNKDLSVGKNLNVYGDTILRTDSKTAFRVLNGTGAPTFGVDTTNGYVRVGDATPDNTGALLILDTKTGADDPMGVSGAMYYNAALQQFRCYRGLSSGDGLWESCGTVPIDRGWSVTDEFLGGSWDSGVIGELGWTNDFQSGSPRLDYGKGMGGASSNRPGVLQMNTGTNANAGTTLTLDRHGVGSVTLASGNIVKTTAGIDGTLANTVFRTGLHNQGANNARPTAGVWWEADPSANGRWQFCYGSNGTAVCSNANNTTPNIASGQWYRLEIRIINTAGGTSHIDYYIDGQKFSVTGATLTTGTLVRPAMACWNSAAAQRLCNIDYYQFSGTASTAR